MYPAFSIEATGLGINSVLVGYDPCSVIPQNPKTKQSALIRYPQGFNAEIAETGELHKFCLVASLQMLEVWTRFAPQRRPAGFLGNAAKGKFDELPAGSGSAQPCGAGEEIHGVAAFTCSKIVP